MSAQRRADTLGLRRAGPCDAVTLAALSAAVYVTTYAGEGIDASIAREVEATCGAAAWQARCASPRRELLLAEHGAGRAVGLIELDPEAAGPHPAARGLEVVRLYVLPSWQRCGVGRRLLAQADERAVALGLPGLWLTAWAGNAPALRAYAALGFADVGATEYRWEDRVFENRVLVRPRPR